MNNMNELRDELAQVFDDLKHNRIKVFNAKELANVAGKMINSAKVQVEYYALRKEKPTIAFLAEDQTKGK